MSLDLDAWQRMWDALEAQRIDRGLFNRLLAAYSEGQRHYHTLQHLRECLAHCEAAASLERRPGEVELALWFHDAVYDPRRADNEERSAEWAARSVRAAGCPEEVAQRVEALVLATRSHAAASDADADTRLLLDIDLAILGAAPARFAQYEQQIRAEYAHVPPAEFAARRRRILAGFLARPRIFLTDAFHDALEARARDNLRGALDAVAE